MDNSLKNKNGSPTIPSDDLKINPDITSKKTMGIFVLRTANEWLEHAKLKPIPKMLFGEFWHENELCILFADTNLGKSILAVQIGNSISSGQPIDQIALEASAQKVIYFDFELSEKQFENRYSKDFFDHYDFNGNFCRVEIDPEADIPIFLDFESYVNNSLEETIQQTGTKIIIIDNITYLRSETENARNALPLMKYLKTLKSKYGLSILALAHTPKRESSKPITRNDLQGSKMLINFVDSCFSIGESQQDKNTRYLKQIKARNTEIIYDAENVYNCEIQKPDNFLEFVFSGLGNEQEHLESYSLKDKKRVITKVKELIQEGMSQRKIAKKLGISVGSVNKYARL